MCYLCFLSHSHMSNNKHVCLIFCHVKCKCNLYYPQSRVGLLITLCVEVTGSVFQLLSSVTELLTVMTGLMRWGVLNIVSFLCHFVNVEYCKY